LGDVAYDDVVIFGSAMAPYLLDAGFDGNRVMFDMVDVDSDKWKQYAAASSGFARLIYSREARALEKLERAAARSFGKTLLVSPFEAETFRQIAPASAARIGSLTNGVDLDQFSPGSYPNPFAAGECAIVMTGRMDYRPNHEGAVWFASEVMPHILRTLPQARAYFVGACPPRALQNLAGPNIVVTGRVPDVRPYLQHAGAVVAPLRIARGVQNKVLEALAMAKPVVATHEATRSLAVTPGNDLWVENDPSRFASAVLAALRSPGRDRVAQNGYDYVKHHHNWAGLLADFEVELDALRQPSVGLTAAQAPHDPAGDRARAKLGAAQ
jgi:sugar transferase (PEP-CTERM/EpsH1 system associated)